MNISKTQTVVIVAAVLIIVLFLIAKSWQGNAQQAVQAQQEMLQSQSLSQHAQDEIDK